MDAKVRHRPDVLTRLAREHRRLRADLEAARSRDLVASPDEATGLAVRLLRHEVVEEVLVSPLLADEDDARLLAERRDEQRLLVRQSTQIVEAAHDGDEPRVATMLQELLATFISHVDREEIEGFVQVRRRTTRRHLLRLAELERHVQLNLDDAEVVAAIGLEEAERRSPLDQVRAAARAVRAILEEMEDDVDEVTDPDATDDEVVRVDDAGDEVVRLEDTDGDTDGHDGADDEDEAGVVRLEDETTTRERRAR